MVAESAAERWASKLAHEAGISSPHKVDGFKKGVEVMLDQLRLSLQKRRISTVGMEETPIDVMLRTMR